MNEVAALNQNGAELLERVVVQGDLSRLTPAERVKYYHAVCESLGLNPLTKPFKYIKLNGELQLYATRDCADQLRTTRGISVTKLERDIVDDICIVTAYGCTRDGRQDSSTGAVFIGNLRGEAKANALMKSETKAKRRLALSLAGLGWLDETETETIPGARTFPAEGVEVVDKEPPEPKAVHLPKPKATQKPVEPPKVELVEEEAPPAETNASHPNKTKISEALCKSIYVAASKVLVNGKPMSHEQVHDLAKGVFKMPELQSLYDLGDGSGESKEKYMALLNALNEKASGNDA